MIKNLFSALDDILIKVKAQKMVFLAVDGVCPRVKMNQQRQRR